LVEERLHLSRGSAGQFAIFLEGPRESFGKLPPLDGLEHADSITALPSSRQFAALRILSSDVVHGNRVLAHIAYELARRLEEYPEIGNEALFGDVEWVLLLLRESEDVLSPERQRGLVGECLLLRTLLMTARKIGLGSTAVLDRWWGHSPSKRDFAAKGLAIEAKSTEQNSRQHHVSSLAQLEPQEADERVYVFSVGLKADLSAPKKLPDFVQEVELNLINDDGSVDAEAVEKFRKQCEAYGYHPRHADLYRGSAGYLKPHLPPALFPESDLDRLRLSSFVNGALPGMVVSVSYVLDIKGPPLADAETEDVLRELLKHPVISYSS